MPPCRRGGGRSQCRVKEQRGCHGRGSSRKARLVPCPAEIGVALIRGDSGTLTSGGVPHGGQESAGVRSPPSHLGRGTSQACRSKPMELKMPWALGSF